MVQLLRLIFERQPADQVSDALLDRARRVSEEVRLWVLRRAGHAASQDSNHQTTLPYVHNLLLYF